MNLDPLSNPLLAGSETIGWVVVHSLWQGIAVALIYLLARTLVPANPGIRYAVAGLALATLALLPVATVWLLSPTAVPITAVTTPEIESAAPRLMSADAVLPAADPPASTETLERWLPTISRVWVFGVLVCSLFHIAGLSGAGRLRRGAAPSVNPEWLAAMQRLSQRLGVDRAVTLLESSTIRVPLVVGWIKPAIIVPAAVFAGLPTAQIEALLAHELAHVRRHDFLVNLLQALIETLFFYHPAAWWLSRQMRQERELCCDDLAVEACGNRKAYARALAGLAELGSARAAALAADGGDRASLLGRIERLWRRPQSRRPAAWLAGAALLALTGAGLAVAMPGAADDPLASPGNSVWAQVPVVGAVGVDPAPSPRAAAGVGGGIRSWSARSEGDDATGKWAWAAFVEGERLQLTMSRKDGGHRQHNSFWIGLDELSGDLGATFRLRRDAGTLVFAGGLRSDGDTRAGAGAVTFEADPSFAQRMQRLGWTVDDDDLLAATLFDVSSAWAKELVAAGYGPADLDWDELVGWRIHDVSPALIAEIEAAGYPDLDADTLLAWRIHDVDPADIDTLRAILGTRPSADDIVAMKIHDVTPERARSLIATFGPLDADELVGFAIHGVDAARLRSFQDLGLGPISSDDAMALAIHGIDADDIAEVRKIGWKIDEVDDAVALKIHGVDAAYAAEMAGAGFGELDPDTLLAFKIHGVTREWVAQMEGLDLGPLDADELVGLRIHAVTPEFVEGFRREKIGGLDVDSVTALAIHGVDLGTVKQLRDRGFDDLDADDLVDYAIHGRRWERR